MDGYSWQRPQDPWDCATIPWLITKRCSLATDGSKRTLLQWDAISMPRNGTVLWIFLSPRGLLQHALPPGTLWSFACCCVRCGVCMPLLLVRPWGSPHLGGTCYTKPLGRHPAWRLTRERLIAVMVLVTIFVIVIVAACDSLGDYHLVFASGRL